MLAIAAAGLPIAWMKGKAVYSAEASIYISPRFLKNLEEDKELELQSNSQYREFVQQNVRTVNRWDIVSEAFHALGEKRSAWQKKGESEVRAIARLQGALQIRPVPDTYQMTVGLEGPSPDGLAEIVNTVVRTYLHKVKKEEFYASDRRIADLESERKRLESEIAERAQERNQLSEELGVSSFTDNYQNPYDRLLVASKDALLAARQKNFDAQAQLAAVDGPPQSDAGTSLTAYAQELASKDASLTSIQSNLNQRRSELLAKMSGLAPSHPGRKAGEREIAEIEAELHKRMDKLADHYAAILLAQRAAEAKQASQVEKDLQKEVDQQSSRASWFSIRFQRGITLNQDIERLRKRLDAIDDRVNFLTLESNAPGFARLFSEARRPEMPVGGGRKKLFLLFVVAAIGLGVIVPAALDVLDPRIQTPTEVERILGFAPMAWVVEQSAKTEDLYRDQILRLAGGILRDVENGSKTFLLTSVKPGGGSSTLALDLGREFQRQGIRAVVVEANAFRPDPRYGTGPGLCAALREETPLEGEVQAAGLGRPATVAVGDTAGERRLPAIPKLFEMVAALPHDVVLIDAPPLVLAADSEFLARGVDVALVVVEALAVSKKEVIHAARTLERVGPKAVGAVVNRVQIFKDAGYFSQMLEEFQTARRKAASELTSPWLWR